MKMMRPTELLGEILIFLCNHSKDMILLVLLKSLEIKYFDKTLEGYILWRILNTYLLVEKFKKENLRYTYDWGLLAVVNSVFLE